MFQIYICLYMHNYLNVFLSSCNSVFRVPDFLSVSLLLTPLLQLLPGTQSIASVFVLPSISGWGSQQCGILSDSHKTTAASVRNCFWDKTRRYGQLLGHPFSSCGGLQPTTNVFWAFVEKQKRNYILPQG